MKARLSNEYKQAAKDVDKEFAQQMFAAPVDVSMKQKKKKEVKVVELAENNATGEDNAGVDAVSDDASSSDSASSNGSSDSDNNGSSDGSEDENDGSSNGEEN